MPPPNPPSMSVTIAKVNVFGVDSSTASSLTYYGQPLYCHVKYDGSALNLSFDESPGEDLDVGTGKPVPPGTVPATVTLSTSATSKTAAQQAQWQLAAVPYQSEKLAWAIRLSADLARGVIYVEPATPATAGPYDSPFRFVIVQDQPSAPEPYRLWRVNNAGNDIIVVPQYASRKTARTVWPYDPGHGIIGPMGVVIDP